jgi:hypothetical protein
MLVRPWGHVERRPEASTLRRELRRHPAIGAFVGDELVDNRTRLATVDLIPSGGLDTRFGDGLSDARPPELSCA